jgi:hypothetical protein
MNPMVANTEIVRTDVFFKDLNPRQQMRLYFLLLALREGRTEQALIVAERMEKFVSACDEGPHSGVPKTAEREQDPPVAIGTSICTDDGVRSERSGATKPVSKAKGLLSDEALRRRFVNAIASGADNRRLAEEFCLSLRQANGLRLGMTRKRFPKHADRAPNPRVEQQNSLPQMRESGQDPLDDVVRFLRQRDDVIVKRGDDFLLNSRHILTAAQLVERANRKRRELGKSEFIARPVSGNGEPPAVTPALVDQI